MAAPANAGTVSFVLDGTVVKSDYVVTYPDRELLVPAPVAATVVDGVLALDDPVIGACVLEANETVITFFMDKNRALINGDELFLEHKPIRRGGFWLLPMGFICEAVGCKLTWASESRIVAEPYRFEPRTDASSLPHSIYVSGVPYAPHVFRCRPTHDQLDVSATDVSTMFGAVVTWDPELKAAVLKFADPIHKIVFFQNKNHALLDGRSVPLSRQPYYTNQMLLLPLEDLCGMLGFTVEQTGMYTLSVTAGGQ
jgi:hypothetical protein